MSDENVGYAKDAFADLAEADKDVLRAWYENLLLLDPRYDDKRVRRVGVRAMVDDEYRRRLVGETGDVLAEEEPGAPEGITVRFFTNTAATLNVVLPPRAGATEEFPARLRDALASRTSEDEGLFGDDWFDNDPHHHDHGVDGRDTWDSRPIAVLELEE